MAARIVTFMQRHIVLFCFVPNKRFWILLSSRTDLAGLSAISKWMDEEVAKKPSLHRAYYRRRANPRADQKQTVRNAYIIVLLLSMIHRRLGCVHGYEIVVDRRA